MNFFNFKDIVSKLYANPSQVIKINITGNMLLPTLNSITHYIPLYRINRIDADKLKNITIEFKATDIKEPYESTALMTLDILIHAISIKEKIWADEFGEVFIEKYETKDLIDEQLVLIKIEKNTS